MISTWKARAMYRVFVSILAYIHTAYGQYK